MKKWIMIIVAMIVLMITATGIAMAISQKNEMDRCDQKIKALAEYTGMEYLGLVNVTDLSRNSGYMYDGSAVTAELLRRAGLDGNSDTWTFFLDEYRDLFICKLTVYEDGQEDIPTFQRKIKTEYLYGEFF